MAGKTRKPQNREWWVADKNKVVDALQEVKDGHSLDEALERLLAESYPTSFDPEK